nr:polysaccharide deacetylase family protein [Salsipaludibacter albus]
MVSEWHTIGADADGDYANTTETFQAQLQELYDRGYRPVTTREYRDATFPIPAGTRPVVLTFDDSTPNHFQWADDGETPDPDSVVGILEDFAAEHEGWRATAVFAYNWNTPFGSSEDDEIAAKLQWLVDHGYELSNHTVSHTSLGDLSDQEVQDELGDNVDNVTELVPEATVDTLTLPFGVHPANDDLALAGTSSDGTSYDHELVFEVGWMPDSSPNHVDYEPESVMRVPAHGPWGAEDIDWWGWLDWLDEDGRAFVSDGDPDTVTYPEGFTDVAAPPDGVATRTYEATVDDASETTSDEG